MSRRLPKRPAEGQSLISSYFQKCVAVCVETAASGARQSSNSLSTSESAPEVQQADDAVSSSSFVDLSASEELLSSPIENPGEQVQPDIEQQLAKSYTELVNDLVVNEVGGLALEDDAKLRVIQGRNPTETTPMPYVAIKDSRKLSGTSQRFLKRSLFEKHTWLGFYDDKGNLTEAGVFCLPCTLFPTIHRSGSARSEYFITKFHRNFKKLSDDADTHGKLAYHLDAQTKMEEFIATSTNPSQRVDTKISEQSQARVAANRKIMFSILRCLEVAGRQGLAIRGHRDDLSADEDERQGNFHAVVRFAIASGDSILENHLKSCARNATYMSNKVQNELLVFMAEDLVSLIIKDVKASQFFGVQADEVTDVSGWEQLGISVRYVKNGEAMEKLVSFVECKSVTGDALCTKLISVLKDIGLDPKSCRAQAFDGAGAMSGHLNGCQAKFKEHVPEATYFHCASHQLNLALTKTCSVKPVQCMLADLQALWIFFKYSPKCQ